MTRWQRVWAAGCPVRPAMNRQAGRRETKCLECRRRKFRFDSVVIVGGYQSRLRQAVIRMKRFHEYPLASAMGRLLADRVASRLSTARPDAVVPVPKFWVKRVLRGNNAAEWLGTAIGKQLDLPVRPALRSRRPTRKQSLLGHDERRRNAAGSLRIAKGYDLSKSHLLLVDDIMTTGATASEAVRVLRRAGASQVTVAVVARAWRGSPNGPRPEGFQGAANAREPGLSG